MFKLQRMKAVGLIALLLAGVFAAPIEDLEGGERKIWH